ncbi:MAG: tRNA(Ile)-lysidine synthase [Chloroflexi bacterium]|nr:MAG: tRNA(Ile)-lysidine synthase [Chloroflexota bacterium]
MSAPAPPFTDRVSRNLVHRIQTACRLSVQELNFHRPARLLVGVSGGPDSSALLLALMPIAPREDWSIVAAHIDHGIAPAADRQRFRDAAHAVADRAGVPLHVIPVNVPASVARTGESVEAVARTLRYQALVQLAASGFAPGHPADAIVVGHTMDDQAESVLLHLIRGSGTDGLAGMSPTSVVPLPDTTTPLLRPALGLRRAEMRRLCAVAGLDPAIDAANADPRYTRVRIRQHILPALAAINPAIVSRLAALAGAVTVDRALLEQLTDNALPQVVLPPHALSHHEAAGPTHPPLARAGLSRRGLQRQPLAIRARLLRRHVLAAGGEPPDWNRTGALLRLVQRGGHRVQCAGGVVVEARQDRLCFRRDGARAP